MYRITGHCHAHDGVDRRRHAGVDGIHSGNSEPEVGAAERPVVRRQPVRDAEAMTVVGLARFLPVTAPLGGRRAGQATAAATRSRLPSICSFDTRGYRPSAFWSRTPLQS